MAVMDMRIDKFRNKATIALSDGRRLEVNFFLNHHSAHHSGSETIYDVLSSVLSFVPLEDIQTNEIIFVAKAQIVSVELLDREVVSSLSLREHQIQVDMLNGEAVDGEILIDMPQSQPRLSDFLNLPHKFLYVHREQGDIVLNKSFIVSVKER